MTRLAERKNASDAEAQASMLVGLALAATIIFSWFGIHVATILLIDWKVRNSWFFAPIFIALQTWLSVGLFIVAHDAMHGTLAPKRPMLNLLIGRFCVTIYAGFSYSKLYDSHHTHHRHAGTADDPDFDEKHPTQFWPWYFNFFRHYFGLREMVILTLVIVSYSWALGDRFPVLLVFWALPALLSSVQLFYFGTFRPHRHVSLPFFDNHRARNENFSWLLSLITCFHFGYHHEHHEKPWVPWWKLSSERKASGVE